MAQDQSSLGGRMANRAPIFNTERLARVTSVKDFQKLGRIEVIFLDFSQPSPVWVIGDIDREPVEGDMVLVGYMYGRRDAPYMMGFVKNESYTTNFVIIRKDSIKLQVPIFEIGKKEGVSHKDVKEKLLDNRKQKQRAYLELSPKGARIHFPISKDGSKKPATITVDESGITIHHPTGIIKHHGGSKGVARIGDAVEVDVKGTDSQGHGIHIVAKGKITAGSTKTKID